MKHKLQLLILFKPRPGILRVSDYCLCLLYVFSYFNGHLLTLFLSLPFFVQNLTPSYTEIQLVIPLIPRFYYY